MKHQLLVQFVMKLAKLHLPDPHLIIEQLWNEREIIYKIVSIQVCAFNFQIKFLVKFEKNTGIG